MSCFIEEDFISCPCALIEHYAMKAYWGSGGIASRILDLGTRWRCMVSFTIRPLYFQGRSPWYPLVRGLGGPQSRSGHCKFKLRHQTYFCENVQECFGIPELTF
jgi:hypothetical protein